MKPFNKLFAVYDPTQEEQPALERAFDVALEISAQVHVFACVYAHPAKSDGDVINADAVLSLHQAKIDEAVAGAIASGVAVSTELAWGKDWYRGVVDAAARHEADLVLKSSYRHSSGKRIFNRTSDWTLIRECHCPVLLVKEGTQVEERRVLSAVDITARSDSYGRLNDNVIRFSKRLRDLRGAEVHFVNAFEDFKGVPSRQELIDSCGADSEQIHIKLGKPGKVIVDQAKRLDVSLVVVGNSARSGLSAALMGNTVEKVLDKLECDVLSMP
ncbi:MAG: universal stress protein [Halioglobus sp.]